MTPALALGLLEKARNWHISGHYEEQRQVCEWVLESVPAHFEALHLLGFYAQTCGDFAKAEEYYAQALAAKPDYAFSRLAHAQMVMMRTGFKAGREGYEARFDAVTEVSGPDWRGLPLARWRGESLTGKRIYIWAEQGLGDIVMFAGLLPHLLEQKPARIALGMFPKLMSVFQRSFPAVAVEPMEFAAYHALAPSVLTAYPKLEQLAAHASVPFSLEPLRATHEYVREHGMFDYAMPLGDLLVYLMPEHKPQGAYLVPDAARVEQLRLQTRVLGAGRRIGIAWHTQNAREALRSIPLKEWMGVLSARGCRIVSLQHGVAASDIDLFCQQNRCQLWADPAINFLQDAESLVALTSIMDEVITIDNSVAHIAGALGIKTTLLLPKGHNFRWGAHADTGTLWYKNVHTLRQKEMFNWRPVMREVADRLSY